MNAPSYQSSKNKLHVYTVLSTKYNSLVGRQGHKCHPHPTPLGFLLYMHLQNLVHTPRQNSPLGGMERANGLPIPPKVFIVPRTITTLHTPQQDTLSQRGSQGVSNSPYPYPMGWNCHSIYFMWGYCHGPGSPVVSLTTRADVHRSRYISPPALSLVPGKSKEIFKFIKYCILHSLQVFIIYLFIYLFTYLLIHLFISLFIHSFISFLFVHSFIHSFIHLFE